jgi:hypothetical protein
MRIQVNPWLAKSGSVLAKLLFLATISTHLSQRNEVAIDSFRDLTASMPLLELPDFAV